MASTTTEVTDRIIHLKTARAKLYEAISSKNNPEVKNAIAEITKFGGNLNKPWSKPADELDEKRLPIFLAAELGNEEAIKLLYNSGTINITQEFCDNPFLATTCYKAARLKLYRGIFLHNNDSNRKCIKDIQLLDDSGLVEPWTEPKDSFNHEEMTPILLAASMHNSETMRLLFNTGKVDGSIEKNGTPLMIDACRTGNEEIVKKVLDNGGKVHAEACYDLLPLNAAIFDTVDSDYTIIYHSDWGNEKLKQDLIAWWKGEKKDFKPSSPLRARWSGPIPLVALLLKNGANPTIENITASPLTVVQNPTSERCIRNFTVSRIKFVHSVGSIPSFKIILASRTKERKFPDVIVDIDYNMPLPTDVDLDDYISEILKSKKVNTMRGLVESFAPVNKDKGLLEKTVHEIKQKTEAASLAARDAQEKAMLAQQKAEDSQKTSAATHAKIAKTSKELQQMQQGLQSQEKHLKQLHDEHVVVYKAHCDEKEYLERVQAIKRDKSSAVYVFYSTVTKELDRVLTGCKLLMNDPTKIDKATFISNVINTLSAHIPAPFNAPATAIGFLAKKYVEHKTRKTQMSVTALVERDHGPMCDDLALILTEHFEDKLIAVPAKKADDLGKKAVGVMFALMCNDKNKLDPLDSFEEIQKQLYESVKTSDYFLKNIEDYSGSAKVGTRALLLSSAKFQLGMDKKDSKDFKSNDPKDSKTSRDSKGAPKEAAKAPAPFLQIPRGTALLLSQESPKSPALIISSRGSAMDAKDSKAAAYSKVDSKSPGPSVSPRCTPVAAGSDAKDAIGRGRSRAIYAV